VKKEEIMMIDNFKQAATALNKVYALTTKTSRKYLDGLNSSKVLLQ
jgi:hypothetical protein